MPPDPSIIDGRLNVPDFVSARRKEIENFHRGLRGSNSKSNKRAFQTLPRVLRRRAASHNVKRIPKRLRGKATREMQAQPAARKRIKKTKELGEDANIAVAKYAKRQLSKSWLPTHIWHQKRAHMVNIWGYMVPQRPTQKQTRLNHRVFNFENKTIVADLSYYGILSIPTTRQALEVVCAMCPKLNTPLYNGQRTWQGVFQGNNLEIGPGVCWRRETELRIMAHPEVCTSIAKTLSSASIAFTNESWDYSTMDMLGMLSLRALLSCLEISKESPLSQLAESSMLPYNAVFSVGASHKRDTSEIRKRQNGLKISQKAVKTLLNCDSHCDIPHKGDFMLQVFKLEDDRLRVVLPRKEMHQLWIAINKLPGVLFGGYETLKQYALSRRARWFPQDFPHTEQGQQWYSRPEFYGRLSANERRSTINGGSTKSVGDNLQKTLDALGQSGVKLIPCSVSLANGSSPNVGTRICQQNGRDTELVGVITSGTYDWCTGHSLGVGFVLDTALMSSAQCFVFANDGTTRRSAALERCDSAV